MSVYWSLSVMESFRSRRSGRYLLYLAQ